MNKYILIVGIIAIAIGAIELFVRPTQVEEDQTGSPLSGLLVGSNAIYAADQQPGDTVSISMAVLQTSGYVVIHEDKDGAPGAILGSSKVLTQGQSTDVSISLSRTSQDGEILYAMLHVDDGDGAFDPTQDGPVKDDQGNIILMTFNISSTAKEPGAISL